MVSRSFHASSRAMHFEAEYDRDHGVRESLLELCIVRAMLRGEIALGYVKNGVVQFTTPSPTLYRAMCQKIAALLKAPCKDSWAERKRLRARLERDRLRLDRMIRHRTIPRPPPPVPARRGRKPRTHRDL